MDKPNGLYIIPPKMVDAFIDKLPVSKVPGIGKVTQEKMKRLNINTGYDLKQKSRVELVRFFGKSGGYYYDIVHNIHVSKVKPNGKRKSIGAERTFSEDISDASEMLIKLKDSADKVYNYMEKKEITGKTITVKIKYHDFAQQTRSKTLESLIKDKRELYNTVEELLWLPTKPEKPVRLLGVSVSNLNTADLDEENSQLTLKF